MNRLSSAETETPTEETEAPATDDLRDGVVAAVKARLGDGVVAEHVTPGVDAWVRVTASQWGRAANQLNELGFTFFDYLSVVDWQPSPWGKSEEPPTTPIVIAEDPKDFDHGITGGETRFQVIARVYSPEQKVGLHLKADVPGDSLTVPTWVDTYLGAEWHEREAWEMYGILFEGNPRTLDHLYLPGAFQGFPGRKDFPLLARHVKPWPGLVDVEAMPGEPDEEEGDATATEGEG